MACSRFATILVLVATIVAGFLGVRTGPTSIEPAWQAGLDLQEAVVEHRGTSVVELATELRAHLGLPEATLHPADRCDLAAAEHSGGVTGKLPPFPEAALDAMISELETDGPAIVRESLELLRSRGGQIRWSPERVDPMGAVAFQTRRDLHVGTDWLRAGLRDATAVQATIAHEVEGHLRYGEYLTCRVLETALLDTDPVDKDALFRAYAYPESEIYAELKELEAHTSANIGDAPERDVVDQVERLREVYPAPMADIVIAAMAARFDADDTLSAAARTMFAAALNG